MRFGICFITGSVGLLVVAAEFFSDHADDDSMVNSKLASPVRVPTFAPINCPQNYIPEVPVTWVYGGIYESCSETCASVGGECIECGYWPQTYEAFIDVYHESVNDWNCGPIDQYYKTCTTFVNELTVGQQYPAQYSGFCFPGTQGNCATDGQQMNRFCPCTTCKTKPGTPTYPPVPNPTHKPTPTPTTTNQPTEQLPISWVVGSMYTSCTYTCQSVGSECIGADYVWPENEEEFSKVMENALSNTCVPAKSPCYSSINDDRNGTSKIEPCTYYGRCYYGSTYHSCDADSGSNQRFCPCSGCHKGEDAV